MVSIFRRILSLLYFSLQLFSWLFFGISLFSSFRVALSLHQVRFFFLGRGVKRRLWLRGFDLWSFFFESLLWEEFLFEFLKFTWAHIIIEGRISVLGVTYRLFNGGQQLRDRRTSLSCRTNSQGSSRPYSPQRRVLLRPLRHRPQRLPWKARRTSRLPKNHPAQTQTQKNCEDLRVETPLGI